MLRNKSPILLSQWQAPSIYLAHNTCITEDLTEFISFILIYAFQVGFYRGFYSEWRHLWQYFNSILATPIVARFAQTATVYLSVDFHARRCTWQRIHCEFHFLPRFNFLMVLRVMSWCAHANLNKNERNHAMRNVLRFEILFIRVLFLF